MMEVFVFPSSGHGLPWSLVQGSFKWYPFFFSFSRTRRAESGHAMDDHLAVRKR
jgi:hypothetical protein